jgi:hypothetical protein
MMGEHLPRHSPAYRRARRCERLAFRTGNLLALAAMSPREIYSGLLGYARDRRFKDGWAAHSFKEIFGVWPRTEDKGEPTRPSVELEAWISARRRPKKKERAA